MLGGIGKRGARASATLSQSNLFRSLISQGDGNLQRGKHGWL